MAPSGLYIVETFIGLMLECIFYGVYCVIFGIYLRIQLARRDGFKGLLFYASTANFILCTAYLSTSLTQGLFWLKSLSLSTDDAKWSNIAYYLTASTDILYTCIDLISQAILIYRCWIMWRKPLVMVVPVILSLAFLATSLIALVYLFKSTVRGPVFPKWFNSIVVSFFSISLAVNALVTALIVFKILVVYHDLNGLKTRGEFVYAGGGPPDLYPVLSISIESGMITLVGQLVQTIIYKFKYLEFSIVSGTVVMFYGISTTIVLVRVEMGLAYDNETQTKIMHALRFAEIESNTNQTPDVTGNLPETI